MKKYLFEYDVEYWRLLPRDKFYKSPVSKGMIMVIMKLINIDDEFYRLTFQTIEKEPTSYRFSMNGGAWDIILNLPTDYKSILLQQNFIFTHKNYHIHGIAGPVKIIHEKIPYDPF